MPVPRRSETIHFCALVFCAASLFPANPAAAQTALTPIDQLRREMLASPATAIVHVSNLHATTHALVHPIDNLIINGAVQARPMSGLFRGLGDEIIGAGQPVRAVSIELVPGQKNDMLRITVATPGNAIAPMAFVLAPGALQSMTVPQLKALVFPVLTPTTMTPATQRTSQAEPPAWLIRKTPAGAEAALRGTVQSSGRTSPALLVIGCPVVAPSPNQQALIPTVVLRVPKSSVSFNVSFVGDKDGDDNGYVHVAVGTTATIHADLASWTVLPEDGKVAPLGLDLKVGELAQLTRAAGAPLRIEVTPTEKPETGLTANFVMPADAAPLKAALDSCLQHATEAEAALHASRSVECPEHEGFVLIDADVKRAATGKPLSPDTERDQGVGWTIPKATKTHAAPKVVLVCSYAIQDQQPVSPKPAKVETLPVPFGSTECESWIRVTESRSEAYCSRRSR